MSKGIDLVKQGRAAEALPLLEREAAREDPPGWATLYLGMAKGMLAASDVPVQAAVDAAVDISPRALALTAAAWAMSEVGCYEEAITFARKAVALGGDPLAKEDLARFLLSSGQRSDEAERIYDEILSEDPMCLNALLGKARALYHKGRLGEAAGAVNTALSVNPKWPYARALRAFLYSYRGKPEASIVDAKKALKYGYEPQSEMHGLIAQGRYRQGQLARAQKSALRALALDGQNTDGHAVLHGIAEDRLGIDIFESGLTEAAFPFLEEVAARECPRGYATLYLAVLKSKRSGNSKSLVQAAEMVSNTVPADVVLQVKGATLCDMGDTEAGLADMREAVRLNPCTKNKTVLASRLAQFGEGMEEACQLYASIPEDDPDPWALDGRAWLDDLDEALAPCLRACEIAPREPCSHYMLARVLAEKGRYLEAAIEYENAMWLGYPDEDEIQAKIAECQAQLARGPE